MTTARTLYFGNPAYLRVKNGQLMIELPREDQTRQVPLEDIGLMVLDHPQITCTQRVFAEALQHQAAILICDQKHMPFGLMVSMQGNNLQGVRVRRQAEIAPEEKKRIWNNIVAAKIRNQADLLLQHHLSSAPLLRWSKMAQAQSDHLEGRAAAFYWPRIFSNHDPIYEGFKRERDGEFPNNLLNYGYTILRAATARAIVCAGILPGLGLFHQNQYNAYPLADDLMEPFRPFVDALVGQILEEEEEEVFMLEKHHKAKLLGVLNQAVSIEGKRGPLSQALHRAAVSLVQCFEGKRKRLVFPMFLNVNPMPTNE